MNYKTIRRMGIQEPPDGYTVEEQALAQILAENTLQTLYSKLPTPRMKFIVAAHFELGHSQVAVAEMLGVSQPALKDEINLIQRVLLGKPYQTRKKKSVVRVEDLMKLLMYMSA